MEESRPRPKTPLAEKRKQWREQMKKHQGEAKIVVIVDDAEDEECPEIKESDDKSGRKIEAEENIDATQTPAAAKFTTEAEVHAPSGPDADLPLGPDVSAETGLEFDEDDDMNFPLSGVVAVRDVGESSQVESTWFASAENVKSEKTDEDKSDTSSGEVEIMHEENVFRWDRGGVMEAAKHCVQCLSAPDKLCELHKNILRSHVKSEPTPDTLLGTLMGQINACKNNTRDFLCISRIPDEHYTENRRK